MTDEQLKEIQERREKATPGPWRVVANESCSHVLGNGLNTSCLLHSNRINDADFIAHSWEDIGTLLNHISALKAQQEKLVEALQGLGTEVIGKGPQKLCFCKRPTHKCHGEDQCVAARTALSQVERGK